MENQIQYALVWKELRQMYLMILVFISLSFGLVAYMYYETTSFGHPNEIQPNALARIVLGVGLPLGLGLAYILAAGNRILEATHNLESFLFSKPVERKTTIQIYYYVSLLSWLVWWFASFLFVWAFNLFFFTEEFYFLNHITKQFPEVMLFTLMIVLAHGLTFCTALITPNLIATSVVFIGSFLIGSFAIFNPEVLQKFASYFSIWFLVVLLIGGLIAGSLYLYQIKQVS